MEDFSAHTHEVPHICLPDAKPGCSSSAWNWTSLLAASRNSDRPGTCDPENTNFLFFLLGATWHVTFLHYGRVRPQILLVQVGRQLVFLDTQVGRYQQRTTFYQDTTHQANLCQMPTGIPIQRREIEQGSLHGNPAVGLIDREPKVHIFSPLRKHK